MKTYNIKEFRPWLPNGDMHVPKPLVYFEDLNELDELVDEVVLVKIEFPKGNYHKKLITGVLCDPREFPKGNYHKKMNHKVVCLDCDFNIVPNIEKGKIIIHHQNFNKEILNPEKRENFTHPPKNKNTETFNPLIYIVIGLIILLILVLVVKSSYNCH
jgi:hypothetical protein